MVPHFISANDKSAAAAAAAAAAFNREVLGVAPHSISAASLKSAAAATTVDSEVPSGAPKL